MNGSAEAQPRSLSCAYLVMQNAADFVTDYELAIAPMRDLGWDIIEVPWRDTSVDWDDYDAVYICTPWDYPDEPELFVDVLTAIDDSSAILVNALQLIRWTLEKSYLRDLESRGADIVPSAWFDSFDAEQVGACFRTFDTDKIVVKPLVGANAADTYVLEHRCGEAIHDELKTVFRKRAFFVQPFIENIQNEGEYSLFYFNGDYSHAILKTPKSGDFRVQEEHGADIQPLTPPKRLIDIATDLLHLVEPQPMYVRADFVRGADDRYLLMELELIEPSLYLRMDAAAPVRFATAFDRFVRAQLKEAAP